MRSIVAPGRLHERAGKPRTPHAPCNPSPRTHCDEPIPPSTTTRGPGRIAANGSRRPPQPFALSRLHSRWPLARGSMSVRPSPALLVPHKPVATDALRRTECPVHHNPSPRTHCTAESRSPKPAWPDLGNARTTPSTSPGRAGRCAASTESVTEVLPRFPPTPADRTGPRQTPN